MSQSRVKKRAPAERSVPVAAQQFAHTRACADTCVMPMLMLLFIGSGCAALFYEIVWFQMLRLVIGSSAVSIAVLLGTFMGGMCLGSLVLPRLIGDHHHPLRVYAVLEIGIGVIGILLYFLIPLIGNLYTGFLGHGFGSVLFRGVVCVICLLPPTVLMGATLPAIARWVEATPRGVSWLGFFYGANIAGAVFGCLWAGFYWLRQHDALITTLVAFGINLIVGGLGIALSLLASHKVTDEPDADVPVPEKAPHAWTIYLAICMSGLTALGAEVVWTRLLSLLLGATTYTFSIILAVFLIGLGIGSSGGAALSRRMASPRVGFALCQAALAGAIAWGACVISGSLPWWPIDPGLSATSWAIFQLDFVRCLWAMLPASILWGASFPLALASVAAKGQESGRLVGGVYAANTLGAILGALGFSMVGIGSLGTQGAQQLMVWLTAGCSLLVLAPLLIRAIGSLLAITPPGKSSGHPSYGAAGNLGIIVLGIGAILLPWGALGFIPSPPRGLIAYGRTLAYYANDLPEFKYVGEGMNASIAVSEEGSGARNFHVSGKVVASSIPTDMRLQHMLGHIPVLLHPNPKKVLIVGCGAGVTAGTFALYPDIEEIVLCEIEPLIPEIADRYFAKENNSIMQDPRLRRVNDDARHFIATTDEKFDIITSDPIHPWVKGAAALYSVEYHELCKQKLNPGGIITLWVPLYESNEPAVKSEFASFFEVFPDATVWHNPDFAYDDYGNYLGEGYDAVAMTGISHIDLDALQEKIKLARPDYYQEMQKRGARPKDIAKLYPIIVISTSYEYPVVTLDMEQQINELPNYDAFVIAATFAARAIDLSDWLRDAQLNTDRNMRLQYLAGESLNAQNGQQIYRNMVRGTRFPNDFFSSRDEESLRLLRQIY